MSPMNPIKLQKALHGVDYPASKDELIKAAENNGADDDVKQFLQGIEDREYEGPNGVSKEISS